MPPLQTTYNDTMGRFVEGMIPDMRTPGQNISRNVENAAGIGFGAAAFQGTADHQIIPANGTATFVGITVLDTTQLQDSYPQYATANIRTKGPIVVTAAAAVTANAAAYVVPADGTITSAATTTVGTTTTDNTQVGKFETSGAAGDLVVLNLT